MSGQLTASESIDLIKRREFAVQKKFGQNFLIDDNILEAIVNAADIKEDDCVLEIGPGMGALTGRLLDRAGKVIAVEVDKMLIPILEQTLGDKENFVLINDDILKVDVESLIEKENGGKPIKVVANLPYYITTPIVLQLLENVHGIESITVMVQKEVAERMMEGPGSKAYGALSLAVRYYSEPSLEINVSKNCFYPRPDVDSAVIRLMVYRPEERPVKASDADKMFKIIRAAFGQRRKTLVNALGNSPSVTATKEQISGALTKLGFEIGIRGEVLTLKDFAKLSDCL